MFLRGFLAGMFAVLMGIVAVGMFAKALSLGLDCEKSWLGVNTISRHIDPGRRYNEENWGAFYECDRGNSWGWQAGYYKNSFSRDSWYGLIAYRPWNVLGARVGGFAGAATGYREHKNDDGPDEPRSGLSPIVGIVASVETKNAGLNFIVGTSVVFLQLKVPF